MIRITLHRTTKPIQSGRASDLHQSLLVYEYSYTVSNHCCKLLILKYLVPKKGLNLPTLRPA